MTLWMSKIRIHTRFTMTTNFHIFIFTAVPTSIYDRDQLLKLQKASQPPKAVFSGSSTRCMLWRESFTSHSAKSPGDSSAAYMTCPSASVVGILFTFCSYTTHVSTQLIELTAPYHVRDEFRAKRTMLLLAFCVHTTNFAARADLFTV